MQKTTRATLKKNLNRAAITLLLLANLTVLIGCQGVSAGGSGGQKQASTLSLSLVTSTLDFGSVAAGSSKTLTITATNSGPDSVTVNSAAISTQSFALVTPSLPVSVGAGQSTTISIMFTPTTAGTFDATLSINSDASNSVMNISLTGIATGISAGQLTLNPASDDFGNVTVGTKSSQTVTVTNVGGSSVNISQASVSGAGFQLTGISLPLTLNPSQSTTLVVSFAPQASGNASGTLTITSDAANSSLTSSLSGTGIALGTLGSNPASLNFGSVAVGSKQALTETVTNTGGTSVTISQVSISGAAFSLSGITAPVTLTAGQTATFTVTFTPTSAASASGSVSIISNASNPALTIALSGTGLASGALGSSPSSLSFGNVIVGSNKSLSETVTNTGGSSVSISQVAVNGTGFDVSGITAPVTLTAGQSATFTVTFTPASAANATGSIVVTSTASNPTLTIPLTGTGVTKGTLGSSPTALSFGSVTIGSNKSLSETVTNTGGSSVTISQVSASGTGFSFSGISTPVTLNAGQSTTFNVTFSPASASGASGNISIISNASNPTLNIALSGTGVSPGTLGANPTTLSFGSVTVGSNKSLSETVTNTGGSSVTISQASISGSGFSMSGITTPLTLTAGQSTTFNVTFTPAAATGASGNISIISNASNTTLNIPLSGTGVSQGTLGANPTTLSFGSVTVGSNRSLSETVTNTGGSSVTISQVSASGTGFSLSGITTPLTLNAGQSTTFNVTFTPASASGASGNISMISNASNPTLNIALSGTGVSQGTLGANPTTLSFGSVPVGSNQSLSETVTNTGGSSATINQATISGTGFSLSGISTPLTLGAGQSTTFTVKFAPSSAGSASGTVTITSTASNPTLTITLSGTGTAATGQLTVNPTTLNLGSVVAGSSGTASGSLIATGANVTVTAVSSNNSVFSVSGLALPVTIPAGQTTPFTVTFSPQVAGAVSATLTFTSNAQPNTTTETVTGTGTPASTHTVNLSWNASTSSDVTGYNIYRAVFTTSCGSYSKINSLLDTSTLYTDSSVVNGTSYCYASTAVNSSNEESGYSNIVSNVQIPIS